MLAGSTRRGLHTAAGLARAEPATCEALMFNAIFNFASFAELQETCKSTESDLTFHRGFSRRGAGCLPWLKREPHEVFKRLLKPANVVINQPETRTDEGLSMERLPFLVFSAILLLAVALFGAWLPRKFAANGSQHSWQQVAYHGRDTSRADASLLAGPSKTCSRHADLRAGCLHACQYSSLARRRGRHIVLA